MCLRGFYEVKCWCQFGRISPSLFFLCLFFSIDFPRFYRRSLRVPRTFLTPRHTRAIKGHYGFQQSTWANVGRHVLPSGLGRGETIALSWDRALSLNDKFLVGMRFWLVVTCSMENTPPGIYLHHLAEEIHPRLRMGTCPTGAFLIPKHVPFYYPNTYHLCYFSVIEGHFSISDCCFSRLLFLILYLYFSL